MQNGFLGYLPKLNRLMTRAGYSAGRRYRGFHQLFLGKKGCFLGARLDRVYVGSFILALCATFIQANLVSQSGKDQSIHIVSHSSSEPVQQQSRNRAVRKSSLNFSFFEDEVPLIHPESPESLVNQLKAYDLWDIEEDTSIQPVVFGSFPPQLKDVTVGAKKRMFLHSLLPVAAVALAEVRYERERLESILAKLVQEKAGMDFSQLSLEMVEGISEKEAAFLATLTTKYRTTDAAELLDRVNVLPVSLILAQGAIESYWGTSRFAREGNNLFGMWTWGEKGIVPAKREAGKTHKIAVYNSILESVRDFILTLNRLSAYSDLREIRRNSMDSMAIADGLFYYSERGRNYIRDVKDVIERNDLQKFDSLPLQGFAHDDSLQDLIASL